MVPIPALPILLLPCPHMSPTRNFLPLSREKGAWAPFLGKPYPPRHGESGSPREKVPKTDSQGPMTTLLDCVKLAHTEENQSDCPQLR